MERDSRLTGKANIPSPIDIGLAVDADLNSVWESNPD